MKQLTVISGKGGTGKTTLVASFASLAKGKVVIADCDVDAPDLHLILKPAIKETREFYGLKKAAIDELKCNLCGECEEHCRFGAITDLRIDPYHCEGCRVCELVCPTGAVQMVDHLSGYAYISDTTFGTMVHADLIPGEENSGKLVAMVREMAKSCAESEGKELVLIDGSPGIGCPVIASITGVDFVLVVTEPTISGVHDLERAIGTMKYFGMKSFVCINKYDLNTEAAESIEEQCSDWGIEVLGKIPFDEKVIESINCGIPVVEVKSLAGDAIRQMWGRIASLIY
jgi:MinD superfamily P-loop ATPase